MKRKGIFKNITKITIPFFILVPAILFLISKDTSTPHLCRRYTNPSRAFRNVFTELLGIRAVDVQKKLDNTWEQLFYGDDNSQRIYYPVGSSMAYIKDIGNNDVRTEGMSYGMMIAVQMNKKKEFDCLWRWVKKYMQHKNGPHEGYFAWHTDENGTIKDPNSAPDGEEWFAMALFFASGRWGDGTGINNYRKEARAVLHTMLHKEQGLENNGIVTNMFDKTYKQVVFVPEGSDAKFTNPSYHLPHFYELWGRWADKDNQFWYDAAAASRQLWKKAADRRTGLMPDYSRFDGTPIDYRNGGHINFRFDAWRTTMNIAVDYAWFHVNPWAKIQCNRIIAFFHAQGKLYGNIYKLDGTQLSDDHSPGLIAMNAVASLASTHKNTKDFVDELWRTPIPSGQNRYYDGMLYFLAFLQVSGNYRIYDPTNK